MGCKVGMKREAILLVWMCGMPASADEGMWLYQQFPKDAVQQKYGFEATSQFLDHLRLSSVRIGGGSGAFVSPRGLLLTNRHLVSGCVPRQDTFYAAAEADEIRCAGLEAGVLVKIEDVTARVKAGARAGATAAKALAERNTATAAIERECAASSGNTCSVVALFSGGRYDLYQYRKYTDVRLVFAPEYALAFFGRERDSLTYLRYGLDIAFLHAYESGRPAATPQYLKWSAAGVKEGELVFAAGSPATTARATTAAQLTFYRDTALPVALARWGPRIQQLTAFAAKSESDRRAAQPVLTAFLESYKSAAGKLIGLRDDRLVSRKTIFDAKIRQAVENDPKLGKEGARYGTRWLRHTRIKSGFEKFINCWKARYTRIGAVSDGSRVGAGRTSNRSGRIHSRRPGDDPAGSISGGIEESERKGSAVKAIPGGRTPEQAAEELVKSTTLKNAAERRQLAANRADVTNSEDRMIRLALLLDEPGRRLRKRREDLIDCSTSVRRNRAVSLRVVR